MSTMDPKEFLSGLSFAIVTCSDTRTLKQDEAGAALAERITEAGGLVCSHMVTLDDRTFIATSIITAIEERGADVVLTCGGTGFGPRDVTPEATGFVIEREAPGIAEAIRLESLKITGRAMLSRGVAGLRGESLVVNLPGSTKGATESFDIISDQFPHAVEMLKGGGHPS